jgi:uncharacterized RDD family membrane protein YckC
MTAIVGTAVKGSSVATRAASQEGRRFHAPFSLRCGALLIDYVLLISIVAMSTLVARMFGGGGRAAGGSAETAGIIISIVATVLNLGIAPGFTGRSAGKWATGLRIQRVNGEPIGFGRAFLRHFVGYPVSFLPLGLGFLLAALTARGRALHDIIAGTMVVREATLATTRPTRPRPGA